MGYRSDVALALSPNGVTAVHATLQDTRLSEDVRTAFACLLGSAYEHRKDEHTGAACLCWVWIKWYPEYTGVALMESLLTSLPADDYLFIRLGEDVTDTEIVGDYYNNPFGLDMRRTIVFDNV